MDLNNIQPNSHTYKGQTDVDDVPKTGKVIEGDIVQKSRSKKRKFANLFLSEDVGSVKEYLLYDLLVPVLKETIVNVIESTSEMLFLGKIKRSNRQNRVMGSSPSYYDYSSRSTMQQAPRTINRGVMYDFDDIYLESRAEAQKVLDVLIDIIDQYGKVSVADYYESVGITSEYTDRNYGWYDLRQAFIEGTRNGYVINMPRCVVIKEGRK